MNAGLHVGTVLVGCLSLACGKLSFFRALAVLHKTDSTPRSAGPVPGPRSPPSLSSVQYLSLSLAQRDLSVTVQQGLGRQWS